MYEPEEYSTRRYVVGGTITSNDTKPELRWPVAADVMLKRHQTIDVGITGLSKQCRRKYTKVHWTPGSPPVEENLDCGLQPAVLARHSRLLQSWPPLPSLGCVLCSLLIERRSSEVPSQSAELGVQGGDRQEPRPNPSPPGPIDLGLGSGCQLPSACLLTGGPGRGQTVPPRAPFFLGLLGPQPPTVLRA